MNRIINLSGLFIIRNTIFRVIGCPARVTEEIDNEAGTGAVYVEGKTWTARSSDGRVLPIGTRVIAERMEGVKLYVKPEPISSTRQS